MFSLQRTSSNYIITLEICEQTVLHTIKMQPLNGLPACQKNVPDSALAAAVSRSFQL